jgi:hypothetical protein
MAPELMDPQADELTVQFRRGPSKPVFAPALWIFGVLLWAYVVAGELAVNLGLPESLAFLGVLAAVGSVWRASTAELRSAQLPWPWLLVPLILAIALFPVILLLAIGMAGHSPSAMISVPIALWFVAAFAVFFGRQRSPRPQRASTSAQHWKTLGVYAVTSLLTLVALISLVSAN